MTLRMEAAPKRSNTTLVASMAVIGILALGLVVVYFQDSASIAALNGTLSSQSNMISGLQTTISSQSEAISTQSSVISSQSQVISSQALNITHLTSLNTNLNSQVSTLNTEVTSLDSQIAADQSTISSLTAKLQSPTLLMWTATTAVPAGYFLYEVVPDTFDYHDTWASSQSVTVYYFSGLQFSDWYQYGLSGVTGSYSTIGPTTSASDTFYLAEGCGGYVAVYSPSNSNIATTFYPNISVTYDPAAQSTGTCA